jgi:hypothetical protein
MNRKIKIHVLCEETDKEHSGTPPEKKKGTSYLIDYLSLSAEREGLPSAIPEREASRQNKCRRYRALSFSICSLCRASSARFQMKNARQLAGHLFCLAEREGFEPSYRTSR